MGDSSIKSKRHPAKSAWQPPLRSKGTQPRGSTLGALSTHPHRRRPARHRSLARAAALTPAGPRCRKPPAEHKQVLPYITSNALEPPDVSPPPTELASLQFGSVPLLLAQNRNSKAALP